MVHKTTVVLLLLLLSHNHCDTTNLLMLLEVAVPATKEKNLLKLEKKNDGEKQSYVLCIIITHRVQLLCQGRESICVMQDKFIDQINSKS